MEPEIAEKFIQAKVYPEHEKLHKIVDQSQTIGAFLDWLTSEKLMVVCVKHDHEAENCDEGERRHSWACGYYDGEFVPAKWLPLLYEYFGIDAKKLSEEKDLMYAEIREGFAGI